MVLDDEGEVVARAPGFEEALLVVDVDPAEALGRRLRDVRRRELDRVRDRRHPQPGVVELTAPRPQAAAVEPSTTPFAPELEQMRLALVTAVRDYVLKNGFTDVVIGVSGGIDSALTAALCVDALGAERVHAVSMPSRFSSEGTRDDAREVSDLRADFREIPIEAIVTAYHEALHGLDGLAAENLQARIRGPMLWPCRTRTGGWSSRRGTSPRWRSGTRRSTATWSAATPCSRTVQDRRLPARTPSERASWARLIPVSTIERPPTAELRADQRDDQSLPPYELLDPVLEALIELDRSREELLEEFDPDTVERALALVDRAEYKRRQAAPGVKLRPRAFGRDWRPPITNRWRG